MERILVIKLGALGDIILAMDAFHSIRQHHQEAHITLLTRPNFSEFAASMPWFDEVIEDKKPKWFQIRRCLEMRRAFREGNYSRIYDLQGNDRTSFYFRLMGRSNSEWCGPAKGCSHHRPDYRKANLTPAERLLQFLESLDVPRAGYADTSWLNGDLTALKLPKKFVMIIPGCSVQHPHKRWPSSHYAELATKLKMASIATVAVGTEMDLDAIDEICRKAPFVINIAGKTDIGQLAETARQSLAVVGNDTGPIHIAAVTGTPTIVLMSGRSDPIRMRPNGPDVQCLRKNDLTDLSASEVMQNLHFRQQ